MKKKSKIIYLEAVHGLLTSSEEEGSMDEEPVSVMVPREERPLRDSSEEPPLPEPPIWGWGLRKEGGVGIEQERVDCFKSHKTCFKTCNSVNSEGAFVIGYSYI